MQVLINPGTGSVCFTVIAIQSLLSSWEPVPLKLVPRKNSLFQARLFIAANIEISQSHLGHSKMLRAAASISRSKIIFVMTREPQADVPCLAVIGPDSLKQASSTCTGSMLKAARLKCIWRCLVIYMPKA